MYLANRVTSETFIIKTKIEGHVMTEINFKELKNQLETAEKEEAPEVASIRSKINQAKEDADTEIRTHQRQIDFSTKEFTVDHVVHLYSEDLKEDKNELFIPEYQRDFKWDQKRQSKLIESLFLGLPIPYIFTADVRHEDDPEIDGRVEIVDGSQRIRTLHAFLHNKLELEELKLLKQLNGFKFEDLPKSRQRRFKRIPIRIIELDEKCDELTRRNLFERINSGSLELVEQEKRHGSTLADTRFYKEVLTPCSENELFHKLAPASKAKIKSGEYKELVLRFFAYLNEKDSYKGTVAPFLNKFLETFTQKDTFDATAYCDEFIATLSFVEEYFPHGFKKTEKANSTPRTRFEAIAVGTALALRECPELKPSDVTKWLYSEDFQTATTSDGANNVGNFHNRLNFVKDNLLGA